MKPSPTILLLAFLILNSQFSILNSFAQQVQLKGVVTVQNSKTYTGKTEYVKNAEVEHLNPQNAKTKDVTGDDGKFILNIKGVEPNTQTQISVALYGNYADYVVVNEKELKNITLGRLTPVSVYVCKKGDLEQRQAEMVGINMRKLEERYEIDKKRLQKELDAIRANNDYLNVRYSEIKDSLDIISKNIDNAFERIKDYAKTMTLENLDDRDDNYVKAHNCFSRGALDSVSYYLKEDDLDLKYKKLLQLQQKTQKKKELVEVLTESIQAEEEFAENIMNELIKQWLLLARTADIQNDYGKAKTYYEKVIHVDSLNLDYLFEFADYLHKINEYTKAEKYYLLCLAISSAQTTDNLKNQLPVLARSLNRLAILHKELNQVTVALSEGEEALEIYKKLAVENPETYLFNVAATLNTLALLHKNINEYSTALKEFGESLNIFRRFAVENPSNYLPQVATILHNLANLHRDVNDYSTALQEFKESLQIRRKLAADDPKKYLQEVANTLNDFANFHNHYKEYSEALQYYREALEIRRGLAVDNPKTFLPFLAATLNNLAVLYSNRREYMEALPLYKEALIIRKEFARENPKVYLSGVAQILNNLAILYQNINDNSNALEKYKEALEINRKLAAENPKAFLSQVAINLHNIAFLKLINEDYAEAFSIFEESLEIRKRLAEEAPKKFLPDVAFSLAHLAYLNNKTDKFSEALELSEEILKIYQKLSDGNQTLYLKEILEVNCDISLFSIYTKKHNQAEQYARRALEMDRNYYIAKKNLAYALLFQNRFSEAENIFKEITLTGTDEAKEDILKEFDLFEKAGAIPEECKNDVEKIRLMLWGN